MAMSSIGFLELLILLLTGGSGNDVLDFLESKSYWRTKKVEVTVAAMVKELEARPVADVGPLIKALGAEDFDAREDAARKLLTVGPDALPQLKKAAVSQDPEVSSRAKGLITQLSRSSMARSVRRLMAIRTLGELKDQTALSALKPLLASGEFFEADYAKQAIAAIKGMPFSRKRVDPKLLLQDLRCLPKACGVLARFEMQPGAPLDLTKVLAEAEGLPPGVDKEKALERLQQTLITFVEQVGNIRLEGITLGVSEEVGRRAGFFTMVARGRYDRDAARVALKGMKLPTAMIVGQEAFSLDREGHLLLPSSNHIALIMGDRRQKLPTEAFAAALKTPPTDMGISKGLAKLLDGVDQNTPLWAIATMSDSYRQAPLLAPFDSVTLQGKQEKDSFALDLRAIGQDAEKIAGAVKMFNEGLQKALTHFESNPQGKMLKPVGEFLRSLEAKQEGQEVRLTGKMKGTGVAAAMPVLFLMYAAPRSEAVKRPVVRK